MKTTHFIPAALALLASTCVCAGAETAAPAAKTAKARALENRALIAKYGKSVATIRYFVKKNAAGVAPKFEIPYMCPNCNSTHWRSSGVSIENEIPAEFTGYVIAPDEIILQDVMIAPEFVDRIEVECAGETVAAHESAACPAEEALFLKTEKPLTAAVPLAWTNGGEPAHPRYFSIVRENGETVSSVSMSLITEFKHYVEAGKDVYTGRPNTLVLDADGNPVTVATRTKLYLGEETFTPPTTWSRESASARFERKQAFEDRLRKAVLPVFVQLEAPPKEEGGSSSFSFSSDDKGNDIDTCVVLIDKMAFVPLKLGAAETARLAKMEATLADGTKAPLEFVGSVADVGAIIVNFPNGVPTGVEPLSLDTRPATVHFGERLRIASLRNKGGRVNITSGELPVWEFRRGKQNSTKIDLDGNVLGMAFDEDDDLGDGNLNLAVGDAGVLAIALETRTEKYGNLDEIGLQGTALAAFAATPAFDKENVPRAADDRKRTPWLGVEIQAAGRDLLREKKATSYFRSYYQDRAAIVTLVAPESPAAQLGIQEGDILLAARLAGTEIEEELLAESDYSSNIPWDEIFEHPMFLEDGGSSDMTPWPNANGGINKILAKYFSVGSEVVVSWISDGVRKEGTCTLTLAPVSFENAPKARNRDLGMTVCDMTYEVRKYFKFADDAPGVVVRKIKAGGPAAVAGIRPLELIIEVNGEGITSAKDFAEKTKGKKDLTFTVRRLTKTRMVPIKL